MQSKYKRDKKEEPKDKAQLQRELCAAAAAGNLSEIFHLLDAGADVNTPGNPDYKWPPVLCAFQSGKVEAVKSLHGRGAPHDTLVGTRQRTLLHLAALHQFAPLVSYYLHHKLSHTQMDATGWMPIHYAAATPNVDIVKELNIIHAAHDARTRAGETPLHVAAAAGQEIIVNYLVDTLEVKVKVEDAQGATPGHHAAEGGHTVIAQKLLSDVGAVHWQDHKGLKPFHYAIMGGHVELATLLLGEYMNFGEVARRGVTAMHVAAMANQVDTMLFLNGKNGLNPTIADALGRQPIHHAAEHGALAALQKLVEVVGQEGTRVRDLKGKSVVHWAAQNGHLAIIQQLLDWKFPIDALDDNGRTAMHYAAEKGDLDLMQLLNANGLSYTATDSQGRQPIHYAARGGSTKVVTFLVQNGSKYDCGDKDGTQPMHLAAEGGHEPIMELLLEKGISYQVRDTLGQTPMHFAAFGGQLGIIDKLIVMNAGKATDVDSKGRNCLIHAARGDQDSCLVKLCDSKYQLNIKFQCQSGMTAMHHAVIKHAETSIMRLRSRGLSCEEPGKEGKLPIHCACNIGDVEIFKYLVSLEAKPDAKDALNRNGYFYAAGTGRIEMLNHLRRQNVSCLNTRSAKKGWTPLHIATSAGFMDCVKFFTDQGLDPMELTTDTKQSAIDIAIEKGHYEIVQVLKEVSGKQVTFKRDQSLAMAIDGPQPVKK